MESAVFCCAIEFTPDSLKITEAKNREYSSTFFVSKEKTSIAISLHLNKARGDEMYLIEVFDDQGSCIAKASQPLCLFKLRKRNIYELFAQTVDLRVKCTISFHPPLDVSNFHLRNNLVLMDNQLAYCKNDPKLMMSFKCSDGDVPAATSVLCSNSPVIDSMYRHDTVESRTRVVKVQDFSVAVVAKMVEFVETNEISDSQGLEMEFCKIANFFDMKRLRAYAASLIAKKMTTENLIKLYQFSQTYNNEELARSCIQFGKKVSQKLLNLANVSEVDGDVLKAFWIAINKNETAS